MTRMRGRARFFWRLYGGFVGLLLLTLTLVGSQVYRRVERDEMRNIEASLHDETLLLAALVAETRRAGGSLQDRVRSLGTEVGTRFTVVAADGTVLADSERDPSTMDNHRDRPELRAASRDGVGTATRHSATLGIKMLYTARAMSASLDAADRPDLVRCALPLTVVEQRLRRTRNLLLAGTGGAVLFGLVLGLVVTRRATRPLNSIAEAASRIAAGDHNHRVEVLSDDELGALARAFNTMADELHHRLESTAEDRNKLAAILSGMVEGVVAVDTDERIMHMNAVAGEMLRADADASVGRRLWEASRVHEVTETVAEVIRTETDLRLQLRLPDHPSDRVLELHASPLYDAEDRLSGAVVVLHDITQLRHLETVRREFVANVSHELKTPVTAIRGIAETILDDPEMPGGVRQQFLGRLKAQTLRLSTLVTDLLTLSRFESSEAPERQPLDLRAPLRESVRSHANDAENKDLAVEIAVPGGVVMVAGDAEALREVVDNLLTNAIRYTPAGGRITVRLEVAGGRARLSVADTGIGIDPRHRDRIFERFYRVDTARSRELGGTGLGLSIVKHIVLVHEGRVWVDSEPGRGSTFHVDLPTVLAEAPSSAA